MWIEVTLVAPGCSRTIGEGPKIKFVPKSRSTVPETA